MDSLGGVLHDHGMELIQSLLRSLGTSRVAEVPVLNWSMIIVYLYALLKLSLNFRRYYAITGLGTTALTNFILFGLSDTLAQTLRNVAKFRASSTDPDAYESPFFSYILDHGRAKRIALDEANDDLAELGLAGASPTPPPEESPENLPKIFDFRRLAFFSLYGLLVSFVQSPWYMFLNAAYNSGAKLITVVQRVVADQLFYSPIMLVVFLSYMTIVVERGDAEAVKRTLSTRYLPTLGVNLCVWPAAQFINFLVMPRSFQIPFSSSLSVLWNTYLSLNTA